MTGHAMTGGWARRRALTLASAAAGFALTAVALAFAGNGDSARAQALINHDSNAPVDFSADSIEVQSRADRVVIAGHVVVQQAGLTLTAARMTVAYTDGGGVDVHRIDAVGGVTVTKGTDRATGDSAIYDLDRRIITMLGNVRLTQNGNQLQGGRMVIDLNSGRANVDGRATGGTAGAPGTASSSGGRVTGRFTVPKRD